jgi:hypothetical protein
VQHATARIAIPTHHALREIHDAAILDRSLVNAWRLSDGREVVAVTGEILVTREAADHGGEIVRAPWPEGASARLAVCLLLSGAGIE